MVNKVLASLQNAPQVWNQIWKKPLPQLSNEISYIDNCERVIQKIIHFTARISSASLAMATILGVALPILKIGGTVSAVAAFTWKVSLLTGVLSAAKIMYVCSLVDGKLKSEALYEQAIETTKTLNGRIATICATGVAVGVILSIMEVGGTVGPVAAFTWKAALLTGILSKTACVYIANLQNQLSWYKK